MYPDQKGHLWQEISKEAGKYPMDLEDQYSLNLVSVAVQMFDKPGFITQKKILI